MQGRSLSWLKIVSLHVQHFSVPLAFVLVSVCFDTAQDSPSLTMQSITEDFDVVFQCSCSFQCVLTQPKMAPHITTHRITGLDVLLAGVSYRCVLTQPKAVPHIAMQRITEHFNVALVSVHGL